MRTLLRMLLCICLCAISISSVYAAPIATDWFLPELAQLESAGLLDSSIQDADLTQPVSRLELCEMLQSFWTKSGKTAPSLPDISPFTDTQNQSVLFCYALDLLNGYGDGQFHPDDLLTRQQIFCVLASLLQQSGLSTTVDMTILSNYVDGWSADEWAWAPTALVIQYDIVAGSDGYLNPQIILSREQALAMLWRTWLLLPEQEAGEIVSDAAQTPEETELFQTNLCSPEERYSDRYVRIFGSMDTPKYQSAAEAEAHMVTITVPVWNFNTEHIKVQTSRSFQVHEAIADTIMAIFVDIFNGPEQFPIYAVGGYSWRGDGTSEHNWGIAIDINPNENYYVYHGIPSVGSYWKPGEDPYSITEDGDVVKAFAKYGFYWGGNAWQSSQDYMHFSYFGG